MRAISSSGFEERKALRVVFVGEEAVDDGGPRREFFSLALQGVANDNTMFQGPENARSFLHNTQALASRRYFYAGKLVALSLAGGGPGFPCLSETVYKYLCYGINAQLALKIEELPDYDIREKLDKVSFCDIQWLF